MDSSRLSRSTTAGYSGFESRTLSLIAMLPGAVLDTTGSSDSGKT